MIHDITESVAIFLVHNPSSIDLQATKTLSNSSAGSACTLYYCKLSSDQRSLIFDPYESDNGSNRSGFEDLKSGIQPIEISKVEFTEILCTPEEDKKGTNFSFFTGSLF